MPLPPSFRLAVPLLLLVIHCIFFPETVLVFPPFDMHAFSSRVPFSFFEVKYHRFFLLQEVSPSSVRPFPLFEAIAGKFLPASPRTLPLFLASGSSVLPNHPLIYVVFLLPPSGIKKASFSRQRCSPSLSVHLLRGVVLFSYSMDDSHLNC